MRNQERIPLCCGVRGSGPGRLLTLFVLPAHTKGMACFLIHCAAVIVAFVLAFSTPNAHSQAEDSGDQISALRRDIPSLRREGKFNEAARLSRHLLNLLRKSHESDSLASPAWMISEWEHLTRTTEFIATLPESAQAELAEGERLGDAALQSFQKREFYEALDPARRQLDIRLCYLGYEHHLVAVSLANYGAYLQYSGNLAAAEPLLRKALERFVALLGSEHPLIASTYNMVGTLRLEQGDLVDAESYYRKSLDMSIKFLGTDHRKVHIVRNNLGKILMDKGDYEGAEEIYRQALDGFRRLEHPYATTSLSNLAGALQAQGEFAKAERHYAEALASFREDQASRAPEVATVLSSIGALLVEQGEYAAAEPYLLESLAIRKDKLRANHPDIVQSLGSVGRLKLAQGDFGTAREMLLQAASGFEIVRQRAGIGLVRATFQQSPYPALALVQLECGNFLGAFEATERNHGRVLADLLVSSNYRPMTHAEAAAEDSLTEALSDLETRLAVLRSAASDDTTGEVIRRVEEAHNRLLAVEADWSAFQQEMATKYPVTEGHVFRLERIQASLSETEALLGWLDVETGKNAYDSWGYVIRSSGPVSWVRLSPASGDTAMPSHVDGARAFRATLATPESPSEAVTLEAQSLWKERVQPLASALEGVEDLIIIPSGAMLGVPVEALRDNEGKLLGDRYAVSYVPSATIHAWLLERSVEEEKKPRDILLLGDPAFDDAYLAELGGKETRVTWPLVSLRSLPASDTLRSALAGNDEALASIPRLPGTRLEIQGIAAVSPAADILLGRDASEQGLVRLAKAGALSRYQTIHLATHAFVDDERPEESALVLSLVNLPDPLEAAIAGSRIYDGLLTAKEIVREWEVDADLVTLSACETGLGKVVQGEGYVGFAHAFLQAGARSLLVSLWPVSDRPTSLLMRRFYENRWGTYKDARNGKIGEPMSKAEALREAKHWLRTLPPQKVAEELRRLEEAAGVQTGFDRDRGLEIIGSESFSEADPCPYSHPFYWSSFVLIGNRK